MKKFENILFCTDLDGTLFNSKKQISKENLDAIEYFKSEGGFFTFITGRVPQTFKTVYETIKPNAPIGCLNGGGVYDHVKGEFLWKQTLSRDCLELVKYVDEKLPEMGIQFNTVNGIFFNKDNEAMEWFRKITGVENIPCSCDELNCDLLKIVFAHTDPKQVDELAKLLLAHPSASNYDFIRSELNLYEILPKGANKGNVLVKIAEILGIDISKTIGIGDYNNDVALIKSAGIGVAVANAVDEAKLVADHITVSNDEHAIRQIIDDLDKGILKI